MKRILAFNRFFETDTATNRVHDARIRIGTFVQHMSQLPEISAFDVAINPADKVGSLGFLEDLSIEHKRLHTYTVNPWGKFVPALNAALEYARGEGYDALLCVSTEMRVTSAQVQALMNQLTDDTLVVGARLEGHVFQPGEQALTGLTTPWNTCALWDIRKLHDMGGFSGIGEALWDPSGKNAGVEEVATIALYQHLHPHWLAKLLEVPGVEWNTGEMDPERKAAHDAKMASKLHRPTNQLVNAGITPGTVLHIPTAT